MSASRWITYYEYEIGREILVRLTDEARHKVLAHGRMLTLPCPVCRAEPGDWCRFPNGTLRSVLHPGREVIEGLDEDQELPDISHQLKEGA